MKNKSESIKFCSDRNIKIISILLFFMLVGVLLVIVGKNQQSFFDEYFEERISFCEYYNGTFYKHNIYGEEVCKINNELFLMKKVNEGFIFIKYGEVYNE